MISNKKTIKLFLVSMFFSCNNNVDTHYLQVTDSIIYYDSMLLINECP